MQPENLAHPENSSETLDHAKVAHANAQEVIKFMDTKTGLVLGLVTLAIGFPFVVFQWLAEQGKDAFISVETVVSLSPAMSLASLVSVVAAVVAGLGSILCSLKALEARATGNTTIAILFPMHGKKRKRSALKSLSRLKRGLSTSEILREFELQLLRLGEILAVKARFLKWSMRLLGAQITLYLMSIFLLILANWRLPNSESTPAAQSAFHSEDK